jgi:hypothetical protein
MRATLKNYSNFEKLSFPFVMDLYRTKMKAEARKDTSALQSLEMTYPFLFDSQFSEFIEELKEAASFVDKKYDENLSKMFEIEERNKKVN